MSKPCKRCGGIERYKDGKCAACVRERQRRYHRNNPEARKESSRRYRQTHQKEIKESKRRHYKKTSEKQIEYSRCWAQENPERRKEIEQRYRQTHPKKQKESQRRWKQAHPERLSAAKHRRRAYKKGAVSEPYNFNTICNHYNNQCVACGRSDLPLTVDHIIPFSKGGDDIASNIQPLCQPCNSSKGNHHQTDYRPDKGPKTPRQLSFWKREKQWQ